MKKKKSLDSFHLQAIRISNFTAETHTGADDAVHHLLQLFGMPDNVLNVCLYANIHIQKKGQGSA